MREITSNKDLGYINITQTWDISATPSMVDYPPHFYTIGDQYTVSLINLEDVDSLKTFTYSVIGTMSSRFLLPQYRLSRNGTSWTNFMDLHSDIDNAPPLDPKEKLLIDIKWIRTGTSTTGEIELLSYELNGELYRETIDGESQFIVATGSSQIVTSPFIYKVFSISDIEVLGTWSGALDIKYRFSQDNSRTWTQWEPFTKENLLTSPVGRLRINPIRFFQIEYLITNNTSSKIKIFDINLIGDFQNVTQGAQKQNLYGIRECCKSNALGSYDSSGNFIPYTSGMQTAGCSADNLFKPLTDDQKSALYNPYNQGNAINLLNKLSNDAQQLLGFRVQYFVTDPDRKGIDYSIHEYQLFNVVCEGELKVSFADNNFPDNQIIMNQFDLNLFETMEVHITKEQFKTVFGEERRPSKMDFLYLCDISRMFLVEHAQQFRGFNNTSIYYKLILKKYNTSANVIPANAEIKSSIDSLTKNTTIKELFGIENDLDKESTANKPQQKTLTREPIRLEYNVRINKELIENGTTIVSKSNYEMASMDFGSPAVVYKNLDHKLSAFDNLSFNCWFSLYNYIGGETYSFYKNYDDTNSLGMKIDLLDDNIYFKLNSDTYTFSFTGATNSVSDLDESVWYALMINLDQRQRVLNQRIYKRNTNREADAKYLNSTTLKLVYSATQSSIGTHEFELEGVSPQILASDMRLTNIRLFNDVISEEYQSQILNSYILGDESKNIIFSDNANSRIVLPYLPLMGDDQ